MAGARYDGLATWYVGFRPSLPEDELEALRRLLGRGPGRCLDIGCGTGVATAALADLGWSPHPGYRPARRYVEAPGVANPDGLRARVGAVDLPLGQLLQTFPDAGLAIDGFEELGHADYPYVVAVRSRA